MSQKNRDNHNRWRSITIAFRISPEENESLNARVRLSGLTKQDYITRRCLEREIVVMGTPRVYKALQETMRMILRKLDEIPQAAKPPEPEFWEIIQVVAETMAGLSKPLGTMTSSGPEKPEPKE